MIILLDFNGNYRGLVHFLIIVEIDTENRTIYRTVNICCFVYAFSVENYR